MAYSIKDSFEESSSVLKQFLDDEDNFKAIERSGDIMVSSLQNGGKIISCGNGGSMCDAMHFAEELTGRYRKNRKAYPAITISDPSH